MTEVKIKQKPENPIMSFAKRLTMFIFAIVCFLPCGWIITVMSYLFVADTWGASLEAEVYPNSSIVHEYWRGGSGSTYDYVWYCTSDSIELVMSFYEDYGFTESEYLSVRQYVGGKIPRNFLAKLFTSIGTGWTDSPPEAFLRFWIVTDNNTEFEQEKCKDGVLIEIGSGYAD